VKRGGKSGGFALPEVLCAIVILSLSLLASFSAMSYALTLTNEARNRMNDFSLLMREGVSFNTWAEYYGTHYFYPELYSSGKIGNDDHTVFGIPDQPRLDATVVQTSTRVFFEDLNFTRKDLHTGEMEWWEDDDDEWTFLNTHGEFLFDEGKGLDEEFEYAGGGLGPEWGDLSNGRWVGIWLDISTFETNFDSAKTKRLMGSPTLVVFSTAYTANNSYNQIQQPWTAGVVSSIPREWQTLGAPLPYFG
jgi:prepilin-type N-terminal cleavage/methylation domain-containing protein